MTITGRAVLLLALGVGAVVVRPESTTVGMWTGAVAVLVFLDYLLAPSPRHLVIERVPTSPVRVGEPTQTAVIVRNRGKRTIRGVLRDAWVPSAGATSNRHKLAVPAGEGVRLVTPLQPTRRGERRADRITVRSLGPLGLATRQSGFDGAGQVRALPAFPSRRHLPGMLVKLQQIEGRAAVRTRGQGTEFDSLRDYVDGDDVRAIDWRATARRQTVVVRTWRPERDRRILMVLDTSRLSAGRVGDTPRLDTAMDAALLLAAVAAKAGDHVAFIAGDQMVRATVPRSSRSDVLARISEVMSQLDPALVEADWTELAAAVADQGRHQSLLVLLTPLEPAAVAETLLPALTHLAERHRIIIASVADPELAAMAATRHDAVDVYGAAAAEVTLDGRHRTATALSTLGITVLDEPPETLAVSLSDHYLALKSRGLL
jgi:uncharacterized protein (DUF58 family)